MCGIMKILPGYENDNNQREWFRNWHIKNRLESEILLDFLSNFQFDDLMIYVSSSFWKEFRIVLGL